MTAVSDAIIQTIAAALQLKTTQVERTVELLHGGNTVPFVARYRKELTGALDEEQIRTIQERYAYAVELEARKTTVIDTIATASHAARPSKSSKISTSPIAPNDAPRPASPEKRAWNRWPLACWRRPLASAISTL
jgi:uncharacterized protein